jgi:serine/threonine protein kinase
MLANDQVLGKGRYRIISNSTHDETGSLYEAYDTVSNSNVVLRETSGNAVEMTPAQLDEAANTFEGEVKPLVEIRHESLLSVQDYFSDIDRHYVVMESVDGCDLTKFLQPDENKPALGDVVNWADQVLSALDYLHSRPQPIIHRDVRPANIRLTSNFKIKLLTPGICGSDVIMAAAGNPADASVLNYRPLEQLWGGLDAASQKVISNSYDDRSRKILQQPLDARSDVYAVGATLYHLLTRTLPKDALERSIEILDGNSDPLVPPAEIDLSIPEEVSEVIMKSMELRREHRYDSAAIMRQVLGAAQQRAKVRRSNDAVPEPPAPEFVSRKNEAKVTSAVREPKKFEKPADQDDSLLEVEPVKTASDDFEWSVDVSEQPSRSSSDVRAFAQNSADGLDFNLDPPPSSNIKFVVAGAVALVALVALLGWLFMGGSSQPEPAKAPAATEHPAVTQEQPPAVTAEQNPAAAPEQEPQINETVTVDSHMDSKPAATKEKKPTPTPAKAPEKKKVTVDDLINDN